MILPSSFPFLGFSIHGKWRVAKNGKVLGTLIMQGGRWGGCFQLQIPPESMFLTSQTEYLRSCEHLGSCLETQSWSLVCYLNVDPPPYVHFASAWCHSHHKCYQALPIFCIFIFFCHFSASVYYTERKLKNKTRGSLGTSNARDDHDMFCVYAQLLAEVVVTVRMVEVPA